MKSEIIFINMNTSGKVYMDQDRPQRLTKDDQGRDVMVPIKNSDEVSEKWKTNRFLEMCHKASLPEWLPEISQLDDRQRAIFNALAEGGKHALLMGDTGTGKTIVALLALRTLHQRYKTVGMTRMGRFKWEMEPARKDETGYSEITIMSGMLRPQYLLIDEVGGGTATGRTPSQHERDILFHLVSEREAEGKRTWITSNMTKNKLEDAYGISLVSRLARAGESIEVELKGGSYRNIPQEGVRGCPRD